MHGPAFCLAPMGDGPALLFWLLTPPLKPHTFCYDPLRWAPVLAMMLRRHGSDLDPDLLVKVVQAMQGLLQVRRLV